ncbi:ribbon-helix-helix domain-containing protein [Methylobacterium sp. Leaf113]|uniref:ribbon-helix-helix domain-containing protein n=1 Tax=Methylobacterium sp. Leaf113 TaxID=1736259 RepID=UPI0006FACE2F|nr:ribbon-helix-helix domain-containing protein [Methylobacterium sp. Leaf113]
MAKPNPLSAVAAQVAESMGHAQGKPKPAPAAEPNSDPATAALAKTSREGKRFLGYYVEPSRHEEIKQAALDEGIQIQELMRQAIDAWMDQNGTEAVAAVARRRVRRLANPK